MHMRTYLIAAALALVAPAHAQRPAIASDLSPEAASVAFEDTVINACLVAVGGGQRIGQVGSGRLEPSRDVEVARQLGAAPGDGVWEAVAARGVVAVKESEGRCTVSVYGPRAQPVMAALSAKLVAAGFERLAAPAQGLHQSLQRAGGGRRVQAMITGSEPGMPGHLSRFPVVTATLFASP
jgi:hypothetical protein